MSGGPRAPVRAGAVHEQRSDGPVPLWVHPRWAEQFPWLVQGTTGRGAVEPSFDLGLSGDQPVGAVLERWRSLLGATRMPGAVHARQVHGAELWVHDVRPPPGVLVMAGVDGHLTDRTGLLLAVSVADCVPVFLLDEEHRAIGLLHAGWRGVAGGILEKAVARLGTRYGTSTDRLRMHCGPAICGTCYEVGPEVHRAVRGDDAAEGTRPIDLRRALLERATASGLVFGRCSVSTHCTRCADGTGRPVEQGPFFSHRGGDAARQMAVMGVRG